MKTLINFCKKHLSKLYIAVTWTAIVLILLSLPGSLFPKESFFKIPNFDKLVHIGLFGGFVFLWCLNISTKKIPTQKLLIIFFYVFCIGCSIGIIMEYVQKYFIPLRDFDPADMVADMIGAGIAYGAANIFLIVEGDAH